MSVPSVGVEEEFLLVDPRTGEPVPRNAEVARHAAERGVDLQLELTTCQVETATDKADTSTGLREQITRLRRLTAEAAEAAGASLLAVGLPPTVPHHFPITDTPRYHRIADRFGMIAHEQAPQWPSSHETLVPVSMSWRRRTVASDASGSLMMVRGWPLTQIVFLSIVGLLAQKGMVKRDGAGGSCGGRCGGHAPAVGGTDGAASRAYAMFISHNDRYSIGAKREPASGCLSPARRDTLLLTE